MNTQTILDALKHMRHHDRRKYDRISALCQRTHVVAVAAENTNTNTLYQSAVVACITKDKDRFHNILDKIERQLIATHKYNFIITNVPDYAIETETDVNVAIGHANIKDTLSGFGSLDSLELLRGKVYVRFTNRDTCRVAHSTLNNMMIGRNIVKTTIV